MSVASTRQAVQTTQTKQTNKPNIIHPCKKIQSCRIVSMTEKIQRTGYERLDADVHAGHERNQRFYKDCAEYFEYLRKKKRSDYDFEDEYYFTMPAISNS